MRRTGWRAAAALSGLVAVGVASGTALAADTPVSIAGFAFAPVTVTVDVGDTVTWTNDDSTAHTATGDGFDTERLAPGQTASITFSTAGTFAYACAIHPQMRGTVVVGAAPATDTPAGATPASTDTLPVGPVREPDVIGSVALLLAVFGASMLGATVWASRRDRPGR